MTSMNAAVVTSFAEPPCYQPFDVPQPRHDGAVGTADYLAELPLLNHGHREDRPAGGRRAGLDPAGKPR